MCVESEVSSLMNSINVYERPTKLIFGRIARSGNKCLEFDFYLSLEPLP